jgi:anti-anti-sigma regulatory factor
MTISLPAVIDRRAVSGLAVEISDVMAKGSHLELDGSAVQHVGQIGLQLLLSAFKTASSRDARVSITQPSAAILNAAKISGTLDLLGLESAHAA